MTANGAMNHSYILVVDDDPGMLALLDIMLRPLSLEVRHASNGYAALDVVATEHPALMILDLQMPGMDGFEVLKRLGENPETADIPVIIFSANVGPPQNSFDEWPSQVLDVIGKTEMRPSEMRELVRDHLA